MLRVQFGQGLTTNTRFCEDATERVRRRRHCFETILINSMSHFATAGSIRPKFNSELKTECFERSVGHRSIHYLELPIGDPFPYFDSSGRRHLRRRFHLRHLFNHGVGEF